LASSTDQRSSGGDRASETRAAQSSLLYRWGATIARHRRLVLVLGVVGLVCSVLLYPRLESALNAPEYGVKGTDSSRVEALLEKRFPGVGSEDDGLVFYSAHRLASGSAFHQVVASVLAVASRQPGVRNVLSPYDPSSVGQISSDEHAAVAALTLGGSTHERFIRARTMQAAVGREARDGVHVWLTGFSPIARDLSDVERIDTERAEAIGVPVALAILLFALGTAVAALAPLLMAGAGLLFTYGVLALLTSLFHFDNLLLAIVTMIGVGIGIDYGLFIVSRFREELVRSERALGLRAHGGEAASGDAGALGGGQAPGGGQTSGEERDRVTDAVATALATSGRTILFSGAIVAVALASLLVVDSPIFREVAVGSVTVVACMLIVAMTLLPALLAQLGAGINRGALPSRFHPADARPQGDEERGGWARWALLIMRRPIPAAILSAGVLLLVAIPVTGLRYGINLGVLSVSSTASGKGESVLARSFSPGAVAPIQIVLTSADGTRDRAVTAGAAKLTGELEGDHHVTGVAERSSAYGVLLTVVSAARIDSPATVALVRHIRRDLAPPIHAHGGPTVLVGGATAITVDFSAEMRSNLPLVVGLILGLSLLCLLGAFRSIVLPIKAVLMNLLVTGAALGLVVWIFQQGHGEHLLSFTNPGFIQAYVPLGMFALLFGLSMDYEIFLIRRVREEWHRTHDNRLAVATGIEHTARPISAAAAIMVAVFGSFLSANLLELKQIGFALAIAIALDASLVRLVLVPATMRLLGSRNWWLPGPLDRLLPDVEID
jgi:putative drug exporter of the RND superfamily